MTSHLSESLIDLFGSLRQKLLDGVRVHELKDLSDDLISASMIAKGAAVKKSDPSRIISQEAQWVLPEVQNLVEEALEAGFSDLILEWSLLLARDKKVLPANTLVPIMRHFLKHPDLAIHIVGVIGPRGFQLAQHFEELALYNPAKWKDPLSFKPRAFRKFAFGLLCMQDPEHALQYLIERFPKMHDEDRNSFLNHIVNHALPEDKLLIGFLSKGKSLQMQVSLARLEFLQKTEFYQFNKAQLETAWKQNQLKSFQFQHPGGQKFQWPPELIWSNIPPDMLIDLAPDSRLFEYIHENELESAFLESFQKYPHSFNRTNYFKWLIKNKRLSEEFPMEKLTQGMDFKSFNACCLEWLETHGGKTDLEAFYKATIHFRHFWSDELCQTLVSFSKLPEITKKFDMLVFWQLMAFKMNPVSVFAGQLPEESRFRVNDILNFEQVIRFRKFMRKQDVR